MKYHVVAYLGDNLGDFPGEPEQPGCCATPRGPSQESGIGWSLWGTRYFMLPNPIYGGWDQMLPKTLRERMLLLRRSAKPAFTQLP